MKNKTIAHIIQDKELSKKIEKFESEIIIAHVLGKNRSTVIAFQETELSDLQYHEIINHIKDRIMGKPIAYILQQKEFWSLPFYMDSSVLIPRPETELLIEIMLEKFTQDKKWRFLDLGTGSGIIAIVLAKLFPQSVITAVDISPQALCIAKKNKERHKVNNITFMESNWFSAFPDPDSTTMLESLSSRYDAIISNPPYLSENDEHLDKGDLRFEPRSALVSGTTGLEAIVEIVSQSKKYLNPETGCVLIEHGFEQEKSVKKIFQKNGFPCIIQKRDLNNLSRVTMGKLSGIKPKD